MFERFSAGARDVVVRAKQEAQRLGQPAIGTEHLLLALLAGGSGRAGAVLADAGVDHDRVLAEVRRRVAEPPPILDDADAEALRSVGIDLDAVLRRIEESFGPGALRRPADEGRRGRFGRRGRSGFSPGAKKVLQLALREAVRLRDDHIGPDHILLGLLRAGDAPAARILADAGADLTDLRRRIESGHRRAA